MDEYLTVNSNDFKRKLFERLCGINSKFKIPYPVSHKLSYDYPKISPIICQNIISCLVKYPKFYEQTLHLMNKMNLPCPLYPFIREPCHIQVKLDSEYVEKLSSESEIENEIEVDLKRKLPDDSNDQIKKIKVKSILKSINLSSNDSKNFKLNEVFERTNHIICKKKTESKEIKVCDRFVFNKESNSMIQKKDLSEAIDELNSPEKKESDLFIKKKDLENNKIKLSELEKLPFFKNYDKGSRNSKIYLKNLSKKITEEDLKFIYGRYIDWSSEEHINAFNIRLMKEGRMKGQAFINFLDENIAEKAIDETQGFIFDSKPIVAQFARSSKSS